MKKFKLQARLLALLFITVMFLGGCNASSSSPRPTPMLTPAQAYPEPEDTYGNPGSLFSESGSSLLFEDSRARRVGDILMINIVENTKSKSKADTSAGRANGIELGVGAFLGRSTFSPVVVGSKFAGDIGDTPLVSATTSSTLDATGETKRENYVTTTIGGRVIQVLPNNVLQIAGAREIKVNDETEYMVVTGLVRSSDILSDNSVLSTQLAELTIEYWGKGVLADKQKAGWLTRLLEVVWPF